MTSTLRNPVLPMSLALLLLLAACDKKAAPQGDTTTETASTNATTQANNETSTTAKPGTNEKATEPAATGKFEKLPFNKANFDPAWPETEGGWTLVDGLRWKDAKGENLLLSSHLRKKVRDDVYTEEVATRHWRKEGEEWKEIRKLRERIDSCDLEVSVSVKIDPAWSLTDLDEDNIGEATFATSAVCSGDLTPASHKVLMIEDGTKFALRGTNQVKYDENLIDGGKFKEDKDFISAPEPFQKHIKEVWKKTALIKEK